MKAPRVLLFLLIALGALVVPAGPAEAHAALLGATPAPGSIIGSSPTEIVVRFSEAVTPVTGRVQVLAPDGKRISGTAVANGSTLRIPVRKAGQPLGTYLVSYRVISADTHPVGGALTFSVGAPSTRPALSDTGTHRSVTLVTPVTRFLAYAGLTLTAGPALFLAFLWPGRRSRRGAVALTFTGLGITALATLGSLWTQAPASTGSAVWDVSPTELGQVLASSYGVTLLVRLGIIGVLAGLLLPALHGTASRTRGVVLAVVALAGLTTWPITGHAGASPLAGAVVAADVVHIAAMSVWLGGLITLTVFLLRGTHPRVLGTILPVWSRWAALSVVWLVAGGVVQAVVQVGSVGALWRTEYGKLLLAKVAVLVVTLTVASYARRLVQRSQVPAAGAARMRRTVGIEVLATAVILGLSSVLVQVNPGRSATVDQDAVQEAGVSQTLSCPLYTLQFNIYPVQVGENNTIHAFAYTPAGAPQPVQEWTVTSRLLGQDLEPVSQPLLPLIPNHHAAGAITFPLPGTYEVSFTVRTTDIDEATVKTTVTVPSASATR
ncbi:copper resistance protein CopC/CopD [Actinoplanes sp. TBRC 11911]|uniref:copper resistance CopC/CopD family protein n=1 Tax=Actinoplanes sp. TBRC 11911 TaxID=2729386 RepID=UPI00145E5BD1|nr:copper resistance protein CopC [Actinoplanes sp. TBRC 11911]NMO56592.1 copper resistance protein CopC/CopD [Actinoplanes sp. TBRC 11911]